MSTLPPLPADYDHLYSAFDCLLCRQLASECDCCCSTCGELKQNCTCKAMLQEEPHAA